MNEYKTFASVYDYLMKDIKYKQWAKYTKKIWNKYNCEPELVLDLGCGTGTLAILLAGMGYDLIGVDNSPEMLSIAVEKAKEKDAGILFLNQQMQNFELFGTVDSIISLFDSVNYITEKDELLNMFMLVHNYLNIGGLFIFDINSVYKYKKVLAYNTFAESLKGCSYIWENFYCDEDKINEYKLSLFLKQDNGLYKNSVEFHYQRAYSIREICSLLKKSGLRLLDTFEAYTFSKPKSNSERIFFVCVRD